MAEEAVLGYLQKNEQIVDSGVFAAEQGISHDEIFNVIKSLNGFRFVDAQKYLSAIDRAFSTSFMESKNAIYFIQKKLLLGELLISFSKSSAVLGALDIVHAHHPQGSPLFHPKELQVEGQKPWIPLQPTLDASRYRMKSLAPGTQKGFDRRIQNLPHQRNQNLDSPTSVLVSKYVPFIPREILSLSSSI